MGITIQGERLKHAVVNPSYRVAVQARLRVGPTARFITVPATVPVPGVSVMVQRGVAGPALKLVLQEASIPTPVRAALPADFRYAVESCAWCRARPGVYCEVCVYKGFVRKGTRRGGARWRNPKERRVRSALELAARATKPLALYGRVFADAMSVGLGGVGTGARPPPARGRGATSSAKQPGSLAQSLGVLFGNVLVSRVLRAAPLYPVANPSASALASYGTARADAVSAGLGGVWTGVRPPLTLGRGATSLAKQPGSSAQALGLLFSTRPDFFTRVLRAAPLFPVADPSASALASYGTARADAVSAGLGGVGTGARPPPTRGRGARGSAKQPGSLAQALGKLFEKRPDFFTRVLRAAPLYPAQE
jgi:hypothetical protein